MPSLNIRKVSQEFMDYVTVKAVERGMTKRDWVMDAVYSHEQCSTLKSEFRTVLDYLSADNSEIPASKIAQWKELVE